MTSLLSLVYDLFDGPKPESLELFDSQKDILTNESGVLETDAVACSGYLGERDLNDNRSFRQRCIDYKYENQQTKKSSLV